jgi:pimeloyl-ACP methyl ester carboxylesterase
MSWLPEWSSFLGTAIVFGVIGSTWRIRRIRRNFTDHRIARFFDWPIDDTGRPTRVYWLEGVTRADVENALNGYTDRYWGWLCRPAMRRALVIANPLSWALTIYGATDRPLSLGFADSSLSVWGLLPIPLWLAVRRSVRLIADAPADLLDERLVALRDRTYVGSYRVLTFAIGLLAANVIIVHDINDTNADTVDAQLRLLVACAYASIWAVSALPSVLLAWTMRNERPISDNPESPTSAKGNIMTTTQTTDGAPDPDTTDVGRRRRRGTSIFAVVLVVALVAGVVAGVVTSLPGDDEGGLDWSPIEGGLQETTLTVPIDHALPDGPTLDVRVLRRPADNPTERIGSLIVNPGGPGFGAETMVVGAEDYFDTELLSRFDIVGLDPRGTGGSTPAIDCIDDYDSFAAATDLTPTDSAGRADQIATFTEFARGCTERTGDAIAHMSTAATARDIDLLRRALGEDTISYFGTSYGCELGATWATLFADTVRAAVLDGCADPTADSAESARQQARGFQASVEAFLATCLRAEAECPIPHEGDPADALRRLWDIAGDTGIPGLPGRPHVNESILQTSIIVSMYSEDIWPTFAAAVAMGLEGDGSVLTQLADAYYQRRADGTWGNELEAFFVISCMSSVERATPEEQAALSAELAEIAPLVYPNGYSSASSCDALPSPADEPVEITGEGAPALVVIGNTGDPATPFASTQRMADALASAVLVAVESNNHGGYGLNDCIDDVVHRYLIDVTVPASETRC